MKTPLLAYALGINFVLCGTVWAQGVLDFADPCKKAEANFKSTTEALSQRAALAVTQFAVWAEHPDTIPDNVLDYYRTAVKEFAFNIWKDTPDGKGTIASWQTTDVGEQKSKFFQFVYPNKVTKDQETVLARSVFIRDYNENIKPQMSKDITELNSEIEKQKSTLDENCKPDVFNQVMRATIGNAVAIVSGNFAAAKNENGDIAKAVRALSGVSLTDILNKGLKGGENSEVSKAMNLFYGGLDKAGFGKENFFVQTIEALDPTRAKIPDLKINQHPDLSVRIDSGTTKNVIRNLTGGILGH